jgi:predicted DNA-binding protein (UPF0251 family)
MSRPVLPRRVRGPIVERVFKPQGVPRRELQTEVLTLDGLEALRLADDEGLYQEEAARRMGVSRATYARVLQEARRVVARALVEGHALSIQGGTVVRDQRSPPTCPVHGEARVGRRCRCGTRRRRTGRCDESGTRERRA